jgi:hypothetical protein
VCQRCPPLSLPAHLCVGSQHQQTVLCLNSVDVMEPGCMAGSDTDNSQTLTYLSPHTNWRFSNSQNFYKISV